MTAALSNFLADLAERVRAASLASADAERTAIDKALESGRLLLEARDACPHGQWLPFIARAGVAERQAQRLMQLARSGLTSDTVSDLGGLKAALRWCSNSELPAAGRMIVVSHPGPEPKPKAFIWPCPTGGHHVAALNFAEDCPHITWTDRPMLSPVAVWHAVWCSLHVKPGAPVSVAEVADDGTIASIVAAVRQMPATGGGR